MVTCLFSAYFGSHSGYHSNGKVELITGFDTSATVLINQKKESEKQLFWPHGRGGGST